MKTLSEPSPTVSIVLPMFNEEHHIASCIECLLRQDYPKEQLEVLIVDGMSTDRSRDIVLEYAERYPLLKLVDNPRQIQPAALNVGIRAARGKYILRMDAHSEYGDDYISQCLYYLEKTGADNAGGPVTTLPGADTSKARCIAAITSHKLVVGGSAFRTSEKPQYTDTCAFGAWRRELFDRIGFFNEALPRGEDNEFNSRIQRYGGKVFMSPQIRIRYFSRDTLRGLMKQAFGNGLCLVLTMVANPWAFKLRYFVPFAFVLWLLVFAVASLLHPLFALPLLGTGCAYTVLLAMVTVQVGQRSGWGAAVHAPLCVTAYHISYGLGTLVGVFRYLVWGRAAREAARRGSCVPDSPASINLGTRVLSETQIAELCPAYVSSDP